MFRKLLFQKWSFLFPHFFFFTEYGFWGLIYHFLTQFYVLKIMWLGEIISPLWSSVSQSVNSIVLRMKFVDIYKAFITTYSTW